MGDLNLTQQRPKVTVNFTDDDGATHSHEFEVLPLDKKRFEGLAAYQKRARTLDETQDVDELAKLVPEFCDSMLRSTNGAVTITSLWENAGLPFSWVMQIAKYLQQEAVGDPPA